MVIFLFYNFFYIYQVIFFQESCPFYPVNLKKIFIITMNSRFYFFNSMCYQSFSIFSLLMLQLVHFGQGAPLKVAVCVLLTWSHSCLSASLLPGTMRCSRLTSDFPTSSHHHPFLPGASAPYCGKCEKSRSGWQECLFHLGNKQLYFVMGAQSEQAVGNEGLRGRVGIEKFQFQQEPCFMIFFKRSRTKCTACGRGYIFRLYLLV